MRIFELFAIGLCRNEKNIIVFSIMNETAFIYIYARLTLELREDIAVLHIIFCWCLHTDQTSINPIFQFNKKRKWTWFMVKNILGWKFVLIALHFTIYRFAFCASPTRIEVIHRACQDEARLLKACTGFLYFSDFNFPVYGLYATEMSYTCESQWY